MAMTNLGHVVPKLSIYPVLESGSPEFSQWMWGPGDL